MNFKSILSLMFLVSGLAWATTSPVEEVEYDGSDPFWGGLRLGWVQILDQNSLSLGGRGGVILAQKHTLGIYAQSTVHDVDFRFSTPQNNDSLHTVRYFGVGLFADTRLLEWNAFSLNAAFYTGWGEVTSRTLQNDGTPKIVQLKRDPIWENELGLDIDWKLNSFIKLCGGIDYRILMGVSRHNLKPADFQTPVVYLGFKAGMFGSK
jgi:hypothetical protein